MPELPEVEVIRKELAPSLSHQTITKIVIRNRQLRWEVSNDLPQQLTGLTIQDIQRRSKYLLFLTEHGTLILHLGMSGRVFLYDRPPPNPGPHDHVDISFTHGWTLRYTDPRRFGCLIWTTDPIAKHKLFVKLGPEPLSRSFNGDYLSQKAKNKKIPVKLLLMDNKIVVGIGNIYANEALFKAHISPLAIAGKVSHARYLLLAKAAKQVLQKAIKAGGTTINDFQNSHGEAGQFSQHLNVYDRENQPCYQCQTLIQKAVINKRSTYYCPHCQKNKGRIRITKQFSLQRELL